MASTMKNCLICKKEFKTYNYLIQTGWGKYCSILCHRLGRRTSINRKCENCGKEFKVTLSRQNKAKFCSYKCYWKNMKGKTEWRKNLGKWGQKGMVGKLCPNYRGGTTLIEKTCLFCKNNFMTMPAEVDRGGGKYCSKKCSGKARWADKAYREKMLKNLLARLKIRPTSLEKQMMDLIHKQNLPYKYTGDGSFWIGYPPKNPDFVNTNGEKKLIEVGCEYFKKRNYGYIKNYIDQRSEHFAKYGWESFIFIQDKLVEEEILNSLRGGVNHG